MPTGRNKICQWCSLLAAQCREHLQSMSNCASIHWAHRCCPCITDASFVLLLTSDTATWKPTLVFTVYLMTGHEMTRLLILNSIEPNSSDPKTDMITHSYIPWAPHLADREPVDEHCRKLHRCDHTHVLSLGPPRALIIASDGMWPQRAGVGVTEALLRSCQCGPRACWSRHDSTTGSCGSVLQPGLMAKWLSGCWSPATFQELMLPALLTDVISPLTPLPQDCSCNESDRKFGHQIRLVIYLGESRLSHVG